jgi:hypothetical protein
MLYVFIIEISYFHRPSIKRLTKRGKENSPSDRYCQCKKEMDDHLPAYQKFFEKVPHSGTTCYRASIIFEKEMTLMTFYFLGRLTAIIVVL